MGLRVFLVEDNPAMREHLAQVLWTEAEVELVGTAETETQAKLWLGLNPTGWDIAVIDLCLKEGSGAGVVEFCRNRQSDQALLVMTNQNVRPLLQRCKLLGADAVYDKTKELDDMVAYCIGMAVEGATGLVWH
jgi:two-component system OmpR family response regulator